MLAKPACLWDFLEAGNRKGLRAVWPQLTWELFALFLKSLFKYSPRLNQGKYYFGQKIENVCGPANSFQKHLFQTGFVDENVTTILVGSGNKYDEITTRGE